MVELGKIATKRMYGTTDGCKFDTLEEAQEYLDTNEQLSIWKNGFITDAICMKTLS